jgi:hypothetical protein
MRSALHDPASTSTSSADFGESGFNMTIEALVAPNIHKAYEGSLCARLPMPASVGF